MRISIVAVGCVATGMALTVHSIYGLWYLSSDLVYVILFPQLVCVVYYKEHTNTYGSLVAYFTGLSLRALGGEDILGLPPIIKYPWYNAELGGQLFPFRTFAMLTSAVMIVGVSRLSIHLFETGKLAAKWDVLGCVVNIPDDVVVVQDPHEELAVLGGSSVAKDYQSSEMNGRSNPGLSLADDDNGNGSTPHAPGEKVRRQSSKAGHKSGPNLNEVPLSSIAAETAADAAAAAKRALTRAISVGTRRPSEVAYVATQL